MTEREKMLAGELYDALDAELVRGRNRARDLCQVLNATREADQAVRRRVLAELFGRGGDSVWMQPPFFCDYGTPATSPTTSSPPATRAGLSGPLPRRIARRPGDVTDA